MAAACYLLSAAIIAIVVLLIGAATVDIGHIAVLRGLGVGVVVVTAAVFGMCVVIGPARCWRSNREVARYIGEWLPTVRSSLISAVDFQSNNPKVRGFSLALVQAHVAQTAQELEQFEPRSIVPHILTRHAAISLAAVLTIGGVLYALSPVATGWSRLRSPSSIAVRSAKRSDVPLARDLSITLHYPTYTDRPSRTIVGTSGDFRALLGTKVELHATTATRASAAELVFEPVGQDESHTLGLQLDDRQLSGSFIVRSPAAYRLRITSSDTHRVDGPARRIEIEPDAPPQAELQAPADELDVHHSQRVELAYTATDDFGIAKVELVWSTGNTTGRRTLAITPPATTQAKMLWDLSDLQVLPGQRISYHLEVTDNDTVRGPKAGRSQSYFLVITDPYSQHERLLSRQQQLFEALLHTLATQLVASRDKLDEQETLQAILDQLAVDVGVVAKAAQDSPVSTPKLNGTLAAMRARLTKLVSAKSKQLHKLRANSSIQASADKHLSELDAKLTREVENNVIVLAGWLDRQRLESLVSAAGRIDKHKQRLRELLAELGRSDSRRTRTEIARALRNLQRQLVALTATQATLTADVIDRFINTEATDTGNATMCLQQVGDLIDADQLTTANAKFRECTGSMETIAGNLESGLAALRADNFPQEQRRFEYLMSKLADAALDQRELAEKVHKLWRRYAKRADELAKAKAGEITRHVTKLLVALRQHLMNIPAHSLTPFAVEELNLISQRGHELEQMLAEQDVSEALAVANQIAAGLMTVHQELRQAASDVASRRARRRFSRAQRPLKTARRTTTRIVDSLRSATPAPKYILGSRDTQLLRRLRRHQRALHNRTLRLGKQAGKLEHSLPGRSGATLQAGITRALDHMERAQHAMRKLDPSNAHQQTRSATTVLQETQKATSEAAHGGTTSRPDLAQERIRIPGVEDYKPPTEFREELLEAMKHDQAPAGFGDLVRRYYEELIR